MLRSIARTVAIPIVSASALASVLAGVAVAAPAAGANIRGELTHAVPLAGLTHFKNAGITVTTVPALHVDNTNSTAAVTYPVIGGNGNVSKHSGSVDLSGSETFASSTGSVTVTRMKLNLQNGTLVGTTGSGAALVVQAQDITTAVSSSGSQSYDASEVSLTAASATYLNNALSTTVFTAGAPSGSLSATWRTSPRHHRLHRRGYYPAP